MELEDIFENDRHWSVLDEETYKELTGLIDPDFLKQGIRAARLARVEYTGFTGSIMRFHVPTKHGGFENYVRFTDWYDQAPDTSLDANERARLLVWAGNVQFHCTCPSFLFWGYEYILTQYDAAMIEIDKFPEKRNPQLKGIVCKHLNRTLKVFPFHISDIAREIKNQFGGKDKPAKPTAGDAEAEVTNAEINAAFDSLPQDIHDSIARLSPERQRLKMIAIRPQLEMLARRMRRK